MQERSTESGRGDAACERAPAASPEAALITVKLHAGHRRDSFRCARSSYIQSYLTAEAQDALDFGYGEVFVVPSGCDGLGIDGYYHLSPSKLDRSSSSNKLQNSLPRGQPIPVYSIAALGRDDQSPKGLGHDLIIDASLRSVMKGGSWGLILYAANQSLVEYYQKENFVLAKKEDSRYREQSSSDPKAKNYLMYGSHRNLLSSDLLKYLGLELPPLS